MDEQGGPAKALMALLLGMVTFFAGCGVVIAISGDDDACAPTTAISSDNGADASVVPGGRSKPMKSTDYQIASGYGPREGGFHHGVDLAGPIGSPIYAAADGTVIAAGPASGFGNWVVINHNINGHLWSTVYGHMFANGVLVKTGDHVTAGQHIADRGNDGESTGPHMHFEVWDGGHRDFTGGHDIDPTGWINDGAEPGAAQPKPQSGPPQNPLAAATAPQTAPSTGDVVATADWDKVAHFESGGNWATDTGNGYQGGLQFSPSTWSGAGGTQYAATADKATREQQMEVANRVLGTQGWNAWPVTSKEAGVTAKKPAPAGTFVDAATKSANAAATPAPEQAAQSGPLPILASNIGSETHWQVDTIRIARAVAAKFPQIQTIGGWRPVDAYDDHPSGRAADIMIPNPTSQDGITLGNDVQKYIMDHKAEFHVVYTIWRQRYTAATGETNIMEDRGGLTANHFDHVHVTDEGHGMPTGSEVYTAPGVTGGGSASNGDCATPDGGTPNGGVDNLAAGQVPATFDPWLRKAGVLCPEISSAFLAGIGKQESGFNPAATSSSNPPAEGAMQFLPGTFTGYGKDDDGNGRASTRDIGDSVMAAGRYSCENAKTIDDAIAAGKVKAPANGGKEKLYAEAYNGGVGPVLAAGGEPSGGDYDTQTRPYGDRVTTYMHQFARQGLPENN